MQVSAKDEKLEFEMEGFVSNANYNTKKSTMILFINRDPPACTTSYQHHLTRSCAE